MSKTEKFWDRAAASYDREEKRAESSYMQLLSKAGQYLKPTDSLLDFACGTGFASNKLASKVLNITAIDFSANMIREAKHKAVEQQLPNVDYYQATLFDERLKPGSYDVIIAFYILHLVNDAPKFVQRMMDLLKPEGIILSASPCMKEKPLLRFFFSLLGKTGLLPPITAFNRSDLEKLFSQEEMELLESNLINRTSNQYFIAARKQHTPVSS
jgi:2-polyprenyl-3-methyl-5-hydroxy-6-metoxy-1,4-benzoquinol methylase